MIWYEISGLILLMILGAALTAYRHDSDLGEDLGAVFARDFVFTCALGLPTSLLAVSVLGPANPMETIGFVILLALGVSLALEIWEYRNGARRRKA